MNYFKQIFYDMRHQKMMTWVSISGTAVSIFLVMVYFMVNNLNTVEVSPESNRQRIYTGLRVNLVSTDDGQMNHTTNLTYSAAKQLYDGLEGVESVSFVANAGLNILAPGQFPVIGLGLVTDGNFWKIYDFDFIEGRAFTDEECFATSPYIVLTESLARSLFGTTDVVGRPVENNGQTYNVIGVVKDVNPILQNTWADAYLPLDQKKREQGSTLWGNPIAGNFKALLLFKENTDADAVRREVESRYATMNSELKSSNVEIVYYGSPYDAETLAVGVSGNSTPDLKKEHRMRYLIYALLILLPAINLSSMMRGRLQHRISEIGVRRAYGAKRLNIVAQLLGENFVVTAIGGAVGLLCSYLFMLFLSADIFSMVKVWSPSALNLQLATPSFGMLFTWSAFFIAVGVCFLLNIFTASVPAWRAASIEPAEALSKSRT